MSRPTGFTRPPALGRLLSWCGLILLTVVGLAAADPAVDRQHADEARVTAAAQAMAADGAKGLAPHLAALRDMLAHIPKGYRKVEQTGTEIRYRAETDADFAAFVRWSEDRARASGGPAPSIVQLPDTYPMASYILAWYYNDAKDGEKAIAAADLGLAVAPAEARLVAEKGQGLLRLHRYDVALALYDKTLTSGEFLTPMGKALLLRAKGFSLTEMRRYDEAEKAYRDSLVLEPDHQLARNELIYIARVRGGAAAAPANMTTYDKAKKGQ